MKLWEITKGIVVSDYGKVTLVLFLVVFDNNIFVDMVGVPDWHKGQGSLINTGNICLYIKFL